MSRHNVALGDGGTVSVTVPDTITFSKPATSTQAAQAIIYEVARQVLPHVRRLPARTEVIRDAAGQVTGSTQHPAADREQVAQAIGLVVARRVLGLDQ